MSDEKLDSIFGPFHSRVKALFASHSVLTKITRSSTTKLRMSALSLSRYLTALYAATFLFLLSSHEMVVNLSGSKGTVLWSTILVLICLANEAFRAIGLSLKAGTASYAEDIFSKIHSEFEGLDEQGREDFPIFMDQLSETFLSAAVKNAMPAEFKFFQILFNRKSEQEKNIPEVDNEYKAAAEKFISLANDSKAFMFEATKKMGEMIGKDITENFAKTVLSALTFFLYIFALSIPLISALITNFKTLFFWIFYLVNILKSFVH